MGIELKNLQVGYNKNIVLSDVNLIIPEGKITIFIGCNGCGKSTLLKSIVQIIPIQNGNVFLDGVDIKSISKKEVSKKISILPQNPTAPEGIIVKDLVAYGRYPYQKPFSNFTKEDFEIIEWGMKKTGVLDYKNKRLTELSGGQIQRVWIALILAQKTKTLFFDEPTSYLDMAHQLEVLEFLKKLNQEDKVTISIVMHDLNHASKFADYIVGIKNGKIIFKGTPKDVINTENLKQLYNINATLLNNEQKGYPICMDYSLINDNK